MLRKTLIGTNLRRLVCLIMFQAICVWAANAQTRTVYTFQDKEVIPSYEELKDQLDQISSRSIGEYRDAFGSSEVKARAILAEIAKPVIMVERLSNCHSEAIQAGWTEQQYSKMSELIKKRDNILRRLKRIQE